MGSTVPLYFISESRRFDRWHRKSCLNDFKTHAQTVQAVGEYMVNYEKNPWAAHNTLIETVRKNLEDRAMFDKNNPPPKLNKLEQVITKLFVRRKNAKNRDGEAIHNS